MKNAVMFLCALVVMTAVGPRAALGHADFILSDPADGTSIDGALETVELHFSAEVSPTGDAFRAMDQAGELRIPTATSSADRSVWVLTFEPPLTGDVAVRWEVKAPDAHPISGVARITAREAGGVGSGLELGAPSGARLDAFVDEATPTSSPFNILGRVLEITGVTLGVGALLFAATALRGYVRPTRMVMFWVRRFAVLVPLGAFIEAIGLVSDQGSIIEALFGSSGFAVLLRLVGGVGLLIAAPLRSPVPSAAAQIWEHESVLVATGHHHAQPMPVEELTARVPTQTDQQAAGGVLWAAVGALILSFLFDGHTVSEGSRLVTALFDVVHVTAASVWIGGVAMLGLVLRNARQSTSSTDLARIVVRFSVVASAAVVGVGLGGLGLAWTILDSFSGLWDTPWGLALSAKLLFTAVAGLCGAYNHRILIPDLERYNAPGITLAQIRAVVLVEISALVAVTGFTAWLVGAAS